MMKKDEKIITLTIEEVKRIEKFLDEVVNAHNQGLVTIYSTGFETIYMVKRLIRKAEGKE